MVTGVGETLFSFPFLRQMLKLVGVRGGGGIADFTHQNHLAFSYTPVCRLSGAAS